MSNARWLKLVSRRDLPACRQYIVEGSFVDLGRSMSIGIGKRRALRRFFQPEVIQLALTALQPVTYLPQGLRLRQLTEHHGDKLIPAGKPLAAVLPLQLAYVLQKIMARNGAKLQKVSG